MSEMNTEKAVPVECFYVDVSQTESQSFLGVLGSAEGFLTCETRYTDRLLGWRIFGTREYIGKVTEHVNMERRKALGWK